MQTPRRKGHALTDRRSHLRLWLVVGAGLAADLASKSLAWHLLGPPPEAGGRNDPHAVLPGFLHLVTSANRGIVFGFNPAEGLGLGEAWARVLTAVLTAATALLIFYIFATSLRRQWGVHVLCGLVLAGALGNLFDRIVFGYVRDFLEVTAEVDLFGRTFGWPYVFNLADVFLVVGVVGVAVTCLFTGRDRPAES